MKPLSSSPEALNDKSVAVVRPLPFVVSAPVGLFCVLYTDCNPPDIEYSTAFADTITREPANADSPTFVIFFIIILFVCLFI